MKLTISTTGAAPNAAGNPSECHQAQDIELRRFFEPDADVAIIDLAPTEALGVAVDLLYQLVEAGVIAGWTLFPEAARLDGSKEA